ncbi:MAG: acetyltransferase and hydrolase with the alpha/beta hydrolase fold [Cyanobacteria bacterium RYN_339]|nr:acetyltransferase and hydrolase with the alpha/beta hydrolase fold [Cyanobacteria bacterium RYN_339]
MGVMLETKPTWTDRVTVGRDWARIERLANTAEAFPEERARANGAHLEADVITGFGSSTPSSRQVLLHAYAGWDGPDRRPPVLLVHGATADAACWIRPYGHKGVGLAERFAADGRRVFAVTFAHKHGCNLLQAEQLNQALRRVRAMAGAGLVDVLAHSKGAVAARALASGFREPWMTPYNNDIRRLILVGAPNGGIDYSFRHPLANLALIPEKACLNAPMSWRKARLFGFWVDTGARSIMTDAGNYFPGQAQMLARWDHRFPLTPYEPDWHATYHGGTGLFGQSDGIDVAIAQSGHFMARLAEHPLHPDVELAMLAGNRANRLGYLNETSGPSDGTVFVESATATADLLCGGATLRACDVLPLNHGELIYHEAAHAWFAKVLA